MVDLTVATFANPFKPGAGHMPPYLAGRTAEQDRVRKLLQQTTILENIVLTGLRGVGKTVLLETFKPIAQSQRWLWISQDMSESASVTELALAERVIADLAVLTSGFLISTEKQKSFGFVTEEKTLSRPIGYLDLKNIFEQTPGLISDKLKAVLIAVWNAIPPGAAAGIVFAYDEAQNLADHSAKSQFPLSMILDVFQSIQRMDIPFMLILTGLPTLFPKLVESRTYSERMFHVMFLTQLTEDASKIAITKPLEGPDALFQFSPSTTESIYQMSGGYPYFIQFICREVFDSCVTQMSQGREARVPITEITYKLDNDFFSGRWAKVTDRQRQLMGVIAKLENCEAEFTVQEVTLASQKILPKPFSNSHVNQMLSSLMDSGLIYKNRYGKYSFAVPMLSAFINRQMSKL